MSLDITLLRLFSTRDKYEKLVRAVPNAALGEVTQVLLKDYGKYYNQFPDVQKIEPDPFTLWFKAFGHKNLKPEQLSRYEGVIREITKPVAPELEAGFTERLVAADTASKLADLLENYNEGEEVNLGMSLRELVDSFDNDTNRKVKTPWVRDDIGDLLGDDENDRGFKWRLPDVGLVMRAMIPGDFGLIAARPDVGKTTFLTDNLTHFASQLPEVFPDQGRTILWFNNEGPGRRIKKRLYQSALNATYSDLIGLQSQGVLVDRYAKAIGGHEDNIRIYDIHDFWNYEVEDIIRQVNPAVIVFDMLDNIRFGGLTANNGQRTDQLLEAMYQWGRVIAVKHDCVVLATSQVSGEGEGMNFPTLSMLKDSRTGKQGAADFIMTIGYNSDYKDSRFLGLTKNKLAREGGPKELRLETLFNGDRARYVPLRLIDEAAYEAGEDPTGGL